MPTIQELSASEVTRLVLCWRILRRDGIALGFTGHDRDIIEAGQRYRSSSSLLPSALVRSSGTSVDSVDVQGALSHSSISEDDLFAGRYDMAQFSMFMVDWQ
jgi:uncharacterized phage protein (TIGR02218 family)